MRNIYYIHYEAFKERDKEFRKLQLPSEDTSVNELVFHPNLKVLFAACSDSIIRIFDVSKNPPSELPNGLVDVPLGKDNKVQKNQAELIKKQNITSMIGLDINYDGSLLLCGSENGFIYMWDVVLAFKNLRVLLCKDKISNGGIIACKFLKNKQFENLNRFVCLTREGKFLIYHLLPNDKKFIFNKLFESTIFDPINTNLAKYNVQTNNFIKYSLFTNTISLQWPILRFEKVLFFSKILLG